VAYYVEDYSIVFGNGERRRFPDLINQVLDFQEAVVLRLETNSLHRTNENVLAYDYHGNFLWQVPERPHFSPHSPYVGLYRKGEMVEVCNWDGLLLTIDPKLGTIVSEGFVTVDRYSSRRPRPTKNYF
jgi:hypothetical protein